MSKQTDEYNWLDDPFDEKKIAKEQQLAGMSSRSKLAVGLGCLVALVVLIVLVFLGVGAMGSLFQ